MKTPPMFWRGLHIIQTITSVKLAVIRIIRTNQTGCFLGMARLFSYSSVKFQSRVANGSESAEGTECRAVERLGIEPSSPDGQSGASPTMLPPHRLAF